MSADSIRKTARTYRGTARNIARLAAALVRGELVAVPTETVYGLAGDALNARACGKIFKAKGRPTNDPLIVHIHDLAQLDELAVRNEAVGKVAAAFWPGALTIVLPKKAIVPALVTSGGASVAVRMPSHPLFRKLLKACGRPLAAPSANPFGYISPTSAAHVRESLGTKIKFILDGGECAIGVESTILDLRDPRRPGILRPGAVSAEEISRVLGRRVRAGVGARAKVSGDAGGQERGRGASAGGANKRGASKETVVAPGMLAKHYSPRTPVVLHARLGKEDVAGAALAVDEAWLFVFKPGGLTKERAKLAGNIFWLAETGGGAGDGLKQAARALFATLRALDRGGWKRIHAERASGTEALALAINDRLTRAAAKG